MPRGGRNVEEARPKGVVGRRPHRKKRGCHFESVDQSKRGAKNDRRGWGFVWGGEERRSLSGNMEIAGDQSGGGGDEICRNKIH